MASIDDRVVAMSFEGSKFESGVAKSLSTLDRLKAALKFTGAGQGLNEIENAGNRVRLTGLGAAVDGVKVKFSALSALALGALAGIGAKAASAGAQLVKGLTVGPISDGLKEYETNLNSVQTIMANTQASGAKLKDVNAALNELNHYSDKTIYNFSEMAKNIGTFTAAGVDLKTATASIKGIANLAALSGSNSGQASTAMYQLSQAISAGRVSLEDWNSVVNAGMGGTVFQRALATTAENMGTLDKGAVKLKGSMKNVTIGGQSFRESITAKPGEKSWLTSDVLTNTLKQFTGDMSVAELKAQGFSDAQIKSIQATAKTAQNAATQVKTLGGVFDTAKESAGSGWAATFQLIFGDFEEAKTLFTGMSNAVNGFIGDSAKARNDALGDWKELGGRDDIIQGLKNAVGALGAVLGPIHDAFREIFPATTGAQLADLSARFKDFTAKLKIGPETANNLKRTFAGLFAVLSIGIQVVKGIFKVIGQLLGAVTSGSGGFLAFTAGIGDFLVSVDQAIKKATTFQTIFKTIGGVLAAPIRLLHTLAGALIGLFDGFDQTDIDNINDGLSSLVDHLGPIGALFKGAGTAGTSFGDAIGKIKAKLQPAIDAIKDVFKSLGEGIASALDSSSFDAVLNVIKTALAGGLVLIFKNFASNLGDALKPGIFENVGESFEALTGSLKAMQANVQADTLKKIAIAIALLTASVVALSFVDAEKLQTALSTLGVAFAELLGAMAILVKISGAAGFVKLPIIAASMILLAGAVDVLVLAVLALSQLSWDELARGLAGVAGLLVGISAAAIPLSANSAGLISAGIGMIAIGVALRILSGAVKSLGELDWKTLGKGLGAVAAALIGIGVAARLFPTGMVAIGVGLIIVATALKLLEGSIKSFGEMDWKTTGKGILVIAGAIASIGAAMRIMPPGLVAQAAGLILVSAALQGIARAVKNMGALDVNTIARGLGTLAASLGILAIGLIAMSGTFAGSAALLVASVSLLALGPALALLGSLSWDTIIHGLVALGATLGVIGVAGVLLAPLIPVLLGLGAALILIGAGVALAGVGILALSAGISALVVAGPAGIKILIDAITAFVAALPGFVEGFIKALVTMVVAIGQHAPEFVAAIAKILVAMAQAVITAAPALFEALTVLIRGGLKVIRDLFPEFVATGFAMLMALLQGIYDNIDQVTIMVVKIVAKFILTLVGLFGSIVAKGAELLGKLVSGILSKIGDLGTAAISGVGKFLGGITGMFGDLISKGAQIIERLIRGISDQVGDLVGKGREAVNKVIDGIKDKFDSVSSAGGDLVDKVKSGISNAVSTVVSAGRDIANSVVSGINALAGSFVEVGRNIIQGVINGIKSISVGSVLGGIVKGAVASAKSAAGIKSPSTVFRDEVGKNITLGIVAGIEGEAGTVNRSLTNMTDDMVSLLSNTLSVVPDILDGIVDLDPTITPVLDLSKIQAGAKELNDISKIVPIDAAASFTQASAISTAQEAAQVAAEETAAAASTQINLEQNNYSPEALSATEIYRQTNNQLSQAKSLLNVA